MRFDISDLRLFVNVVERGSISLGANATYLAPASASERIKGMEHELGTPLLIREPKGVTPTPAGFVLLTHARAMLDLNEKMRNEMVEYAKGLRGKLRLLSNTAALSEILPDLVSEFLIKNPSIDLDVEERDSQAIVDAVMNRERDAGFIADFATTGQLSLIPVAIDQLVLVMHPTHELAGQDTVEFKAIVQQELVGLLSDRALTRHLDRQAALISHRLRWRAQMPSFDGICGLAARGAAVGIVSESAARRTNISLPLCIMPISEQWARRQLYLCYRDDKQQGHHLGAFVEHVRSYSSQIA